MHTRRQDQRTENKVENQTILIDSELIKIFTLLDMVLKITAINMFKKKMRRWRISSQKYNLR